MYSSPMQPLIDLELYEKFRKIREDLPKRGVSNIAQVFVPIGQLKTKEPPSSVQPSVLFVGRATREYYQDNVSTYNGSIEQNIGIFRDEKKAFWTFVRNISKELTQLSAKDNQHPLACAAGWTNLAKIGDTKGNPTPLSLEIQGKLCCEALRKEIRLMRPDAIVLVTGCYKKPYATAEIFEPVFGADGWEQKNAFMRCKTSAEHEAFLVHTDRPEYKPGMRDMAKTIASLINSTIKGGGVIDA